MKLQVEHLELHVALWLRSYRGAGSAMAPSEDGQPRKSWENCMAKGCPQIFESNIWKCSPLAYLRMQDAKVGLSEKWQPYLAYRPLQAGCTDEEMRGFFAREEEGCCAMWPAEPERFVMSSPLGRRGVSTNAAIGVSLSIQWKEDRCIQRTVCGRQ